MPKLLVIGHNWPEPKTTAAGHRMMQLLKAFKQKSYNIHFGSSALRTEFSENLAVDGIEEVEIQLNHASFDDFVQKLRPNIVIFDRFLTEEQFGWRVAENVPNALRILNTEDLHSLRNYREHTIKKGVALENRDWLTTDKAKREIASIFRSDITLLVSDFEERLLRNEIGVPKSHLLHLPFMLSGITKEEIKFQPSFKERKDFVCFGNGRHAPNVDSMLYLKDKLWPKIKKQLPSRSLPFR